MRLTISALGFELDVTLGREETEVGIDPGDCTTYPLDFTPSPTDQAWQPGVER